MSEMTIALVGNPNCGKSTLFNELTGARQKVGNWPGVTVECKTGHYKNQNQQVNVVDLPGIYQLSLSDDERAVDEKIACSFILSNHVDVIVNIIDGSHLERHLYLTLQLLAMKVPLIIAVNMIDVAERRKIELKLTKLEKLLGRPVISLVANKGKGVSQLKHIIASYSHRVVNVPNLLECPLPLVDAVDSLAKKITHNQPEFEFCAPWLAQQILQYEDCSDIDLSIREFASELKNKLERELNEELDIVFADLHYTAANRITKEVTIQTAIKKTVTERVDKIILNRILGIPIFLAIMYSMFFFAINIGGAFQDFFDISSEAVFVQGMTHLLTLMQAPNWLIALLAAGFGRGINTTISFIPVISGMLFFLAFLESSGYMARASFVIDRFMRTIGLPGKSFVPMIVGFGCNVPAILATRTLENPRDRMLTILMSPFMSCSARLAIFAVFTAAFFPTGGQNIVFSLYIIGIIAAVLTGLILRKTLLKGELTPLVLELPSYHVPSFSSLMSQTWLGLKTFVFRASKVIIPVCMFIGILNAINVDGTLNKNNSSSTSLLASIGRVVTPVLEPMGIQENNWPATVGLVTGVLAKEVVVGTLNTLYTQESHLADTDWNASIKDTLKEAINSVPINLIALKNSFSNPVIASAPEHTLNHHVYGVMYEQFKGQTAAFAYLLFVLLYFPCISATAVMTKESNKSWTLFSVAWSTGIAYAVATSFYQLATFFSHPEQSFLWVVTIIILFSGVLAIMKRCGLQEGGYKACC